MQSHKDMNAAARALLALNARKAGKQWEDIAQECGYGSPSAAYNAATRLLKSVQADDVSEYRTLTLMRLDDAMRAIQRQALGYTAVDEDGGVVAVAPDLWAMDRYLRIIEMQCKLYNLYDDTVAAYPAQVLIRAIGISQEALDAV